MHNEESLVIAILSEYISLLREPAHSDTLGCRSINKNITPKNKSVDSHGRRKYEPPLIFPRKGGAIILGCRWAIAGVGGRKDGEAGPHDPRVSRTDCNAMSSEAPCYSVHNVWTLKMLCNTLLFKS